MLSVQQPQLTIVCVSCFVFARHSSFVLCGHPHQFHSALTSSSYPDSFCSSPSSLLLGYYKTESDFTMRIKPTTAYENICICYNKIVVNLLHISVTFCGHPKEVIFEGYITETTKPMYNYKILSFKYMIHSIY